MTEAEFGELDFEEFIFRLEMLTEEKRENSKQRMIAASFTAWQMRETKTTFDEYLRIFGLAEKQGKIPKEVRRKMIDRSIAIAERIRKAGLKQRKKK